MEFNENISQLKLKKTKFNDIKKKLSFINIYNYDSFHPKLSAKLK